jgi:hypothetical protein
MGSRADSADPLVLTGTWNGLYSYPRVIEPTPFTATLTENDGWLSGAIEEIARVGPTRGQPLTATLQGCRNGHSVTFLKMYDNPPPGYDAVHYSGDVNHDGSEIGGCWTIPGVWSGNFLMIRAGAVRAAESQDIAERV